MSLHPNHVCFHYKSAHTVGVWEDRHHIAVSTRRNIYIDEAIVMTIVHFARRKFITIRTSSLASNPPLQFTEGSVTASVKQTPILSQVRTMRNRLGDILWSWSMQNNSNIFKSFLAWNEMRLFQVKVRKTLNAVASHNSHLPRLYLKGSNSFK